MLAPIAQARRPLPLTRTGVLLALVVLVAALGVSPPPPAAAVSPGLAAIIAQSPEQPVAVIVRGNASPTALAEAVRNAGGVVGAELALINAVAATVPAANIPVLARNPVVTALSLDAPVASSQTDPSSTVAEDWWTRIDTSQLVNPYPVAIGANKLWDRPSNPLRGEGITVAVIDSGVSPSMDFWTLMGRGRITADQAFQTGWDTMPYDSYGHGTHVGGIIAGNGLSMDGLYIGVAPEADVVNVRVLDAEGAGPMSSVIKGLEWVYKNAKQYNIRVVNISLNSLEAESYKTNPLCAAVEALWVNGIVVVVSAGNYGENALYPPANDPFVITVGATDDKGTMDTADDAMAPFSAWGRTTDGISKPDLVAPGTNIVSVLSAMNSTLDLDHPEKAVDDHYFIMSGTSMAAPMVSGAAALLLQSEPNLTPDQVKYRLTATARPFSTRARAGAGYVDVYAAVTNRLAGKANQGVQVSPVLGGKTALFWDAATQGSVSWGGKGSSFFGSVSWGGKTTGTSASDFWAP